VGEAVKPVAVLFCRRDSWYKSQPLLDCFDEDRDALTWRGGCPGIFHPPCRGWGKLKGFAKVRPGELELASWSMAQVRQWGGVVEHPLQSSLWAASDCLSWGVRDQFGGVLVSLKQGWFGHRADKATGLYIVGAAAPDLDPVELVQPHSVELMGRAERERTPTPFGELLVNLARSSLGGSEAWRVDQDSGDSSTSPRERTAPARHCLP
jgi:hypothetical protein